MSNDPIENIVNLLINKENIYSIPVPIESIAKKYAILKKYSIPFNFDGITIKEKGRIPQIIINENQGLQRQNFTIAHELGHIIIPWHVGIILDQSINTNFDIDYEYYEYEAEANRFSSLLLLPHNIIELKLESFLKKEHDLSDFIQLLASKAKVSSLTTIFRVFKFLPPNFAYIITNHDNRVEYSGSSKGTSVEVPRKGTKINKSRYFYKDYRKSEYETEWQKYLFFQFHEKHIIPLCTEDQDWRSVLNSILNRNFADQKQIERSYKSVNAIIGSYYGTHLKGRNYDFNTFYTAIYERVINREELVWLNSDEDFLKFISSKISDLFRKG